MTDTLAPLRAEVARLSQPPPAGSLRHLIRNLRLAAEPERPDLVIVACGQRKAAQCSAAWELYTGPYFRACLGYARALADSAPADCIHILSAKYGLIPGDREVDPYELRLGQPGSVTAATVRAQAEELVLLYRRRVMVLGGRDYVDLARTVWPEAEAPLAGVGGIGQQMAQLRTWTAEAETR